ncbi:septum site-determining protein MinC [Helicobacter sp. 11S02596-1]|uniref:septum site-determining protein MinC n=1 Tax=Helicobacter sp. 11S02596-1 TaxID=1476194 RepID=UPI000BA58553|nr:septum site-determining protein MinC [Helicobacter sp. 11S02596-1]PAF43197.1 hypothetical protein BJI48_05490 [Helicobacter sp. 11S02596-1]
MIKTRQKNIRVFELESGQSAEYIEFVTKNFVLLKDYLLVFKAPIEPALTAVLGELKMTYIIAENELRGRELTKTPTINAIDTKTEICNRNIRSGEELESSGDIIILGNVNNGARIVSERNISIYGKCEGIIVCGGQYLILKTLCSHHIVFQGEILGPEIIEKLSSNDLLKIITKNGDNISVKEIK